MSSTRSDAAAAEPYEYDFEPWGGEPPYVWQVESGALPAGLTLNSSTGTIAGTPRSVGTSTFSLRVTSSDFATQAGRRKTFVSRELTLDVVVHDVGLVTEWAMRDCIGDVVTITEPKASFLPPSGASWLLLVGDLTAMPAMARIAETHPDLPTQVMAEVPDDLTGYLPATADVTWLTPPAPGQSALAPETSVAIGSVATGNMPANFAAAMPGATTAQGGRGGRGAALGAGARPGMRWRTYLELGRVSNLPTVWSNALVGSVAALFWWMTGVGAVVWLFVIALALYYVRTARGEKNHRRDAWLILGGGVVFPTVTLTIPRAPK